jgi:hypothetical protein
MQEEKNTDLAQQPDQKPGDLLLLPAPKVDNLEKKASWGGAREGGGRPLGSLGKATIEKKLARKALEQRILQAADEILNAQKVLARGQQFLYKIEKIEVKGPNGGISYRNDKPKLVTEQWEIENYLDELVDKANGDLEDETNPGATYYYITTKEPNNMAIDSMFDRVFGKARQSLGLDGGEDENGKPKPIYGGLSIQRYDGNPQNIPTQ